MSKLGQFLDNHDTLVEFAIDTIGMAGAVAMLGGFGMAAFGAEAMGAWSLVGIPLAVIGTAVVEANRFIQKDHHRESYSKIFGLDREKSKTKEQVSENAKTLNKIVELAAEKTGHEVHYGTDGKLTGKFEMYSNGGKLTESTTYVDGKRMKKSPETERPIEGACWADRKDLARKSKYLDQESLVARKLREDAVAKAKEEGKPLSADEVMKLRAKEEKARLAANKKYGSIRRAGLKEGR